jgi:TolA-binding protein
MPGTNFKQARIQFTCIITILTLAGFLGGCAYFNTLYNARTDFRKANEMPKSKDGSLSIQQVSLYEEVIKKCESLITTYPTSKWVDDAVLLMGKAFYEKKDYDEAITKFNELAQNFPDSKLNEEGQVYLARSYLIKENSDQAIQVLKLFLKKHKKSRYREEALFLLGTTMMKQGDSSEAMKTLNQLAKEYPKSHYKREADFRMAELFMDRGDFKESQQIYERLSSERLTPELRITCLSKLAEIYLQEEKHGRVLGTVARLSKLDLSPNEEAEAMLLRARALTGIDSITRAVRAYHLIKLRYPKSVYTAEALYYLGIIYQEKMDSLELAKKTFEEVPKQYPQSPFAKDAIKRSVSISNLLKYSKSLGTESKEQDAQTQFMLGEIQLFQFNNPDRALKEYKKVIQDYSDSDFAPKAAYSIGYIYGIVMGDTIKAREAYEYLLAHYPDSQQAEYARYFLEKKEAASEEVKP